MPLDAAARAAFLAHLPSLAPGADAAGVVAFWRAQPEACADELGAVPGHDEVRAGLLRLLPAVTDATARAPWVAAAREALEAYGPEDTDGADALRRHPAWVGLAWLEWADVAGATDDALARAVDAARRGFAAAAKPVPQDTGEVLWALAEAAGDQGWHDRGDPLLDAAWAAPFADPVQRGRVGLVRVMRHLATDEAAAVTAVAAVLADDELDAQTRVHALWIGAHLDRERGRLARAVARLEEALQVVDRPDDGEVATRIEEALRAWGARGDGAEA